MIKNLLARFRLGSNSQFPAPNSSNYHEDQLSALCTAPIQEALLTLNTTLQGLTAEAAEKRLDKFGPNELSHLKRLGFFADMAHRMRSPLVIQLVVIALVSGIIGELKSTVIVFAMIVLSVGLSYVLDRRSSLTVEALGKRVQSRTFALRDGVEAEVRISEIVPGDIVLLQAGSIVPADLRLIVAKDFFVSQSAMTGESMPVEKTCSAAESAVLQSAMELPNACFLGTSVTSGTARGIVINTGIRTLYGAISERLSDIREETSFDRGVRSFTWLMIRFMVVMVCAVFFIVGLTKGQLVRGAFVRPVHCCRPHP